jgi:hypothetical protein
MPAQHHWHSGALDVAQRMAQVVRGTVCRHEGFFLTDTGQTTGGPPDLSASSRDLWHGILGPACAPSTGAR